MAMIGRNAAVVEIGKRRRELHGVVAFGTWLAVHAWLLSGFRERATAVWAWGWDYFTREPSPIDHRPRRVAHRLGRAGGRLRLTPTRGAATMADQSISGVRRWAKWWVAEGRVSSSPGS